MLLTRVDNRITKICWNAINVSWIFLHHVDYETAFTKKFIQIFKKWPKYLKLMFLFTLQKMHKQLNPFAIFLWVVWHVLMKWKNTIDQNNNIRRPDDNPICNERRDRTIRPESEVGGKDFWLSTKKKIFAWLASLTVLTRSMIVFLLVWCLMMSSIFLRMSK